MPALLKTCQCGAKHDSIAWSHLRYIGEQTCPGVRLELRLCTCGTTLAICLEGAEILAAERSAA